jgi:hypothetical protein
MGNLSDNFIPMIGTPSDISAIQNSQRNGEGVVVPVVFGKCRVDGNQLWIGDIAVLDSTTGVTQAERDIASRKLQRYGDSTRAYQASVWFALGMGKLILEKILANDKVLTPDIDYDPLSDYNDGTEDSFPAIQKLLLFLIGQTNMGDEVRYAWSSNGTNFLTIEYYKGAGKQYSFEGFVSNGIVTLAFMQSSFLFIETKVVSSPTGIDFTDSQTIAPFNFGASAYGNGVFMMVGKNNDKISGYYSITNGVSWLIDTIVDLDKFGKLNGIAYGNGVFIAVGYDSGAAKGLVVKGTVGSWSIITTSLTFQTINSIAFGGGAFVMVTNTNKVYYSSDTGATWTLVHTASKPLNKVQYIDSKNYFIAVGNDGCVIKSTGGFVWTNPNTLPSANDYYGIDGGDGILIVTGQNKKVYKSINDGVVWTDISAQYSSGILKTLSSVYYNRFGEFDWASKLKGIAHIYLPFSTDTTADFSVVCNSEGKTPAMKFEVRNDLAHLENVIGGAALSESAPAMYDALGNYQGNNPAAIIYEVLTNTQWGLGIDSSLIDLPSFNYVAESFTYDRHYGLSFILDNLTTAKEVIDRVKDATDVFIYEEGGKLFLGMLYDINATPVLDLLDNDCSNVSVNRQTWKQLDNVYEAEYTDPAMNFEQKTIIIKNEAAILNAGGYERKKKIDLKDYISKSMASSRLNEVMQRESFPKTFVTLDINRKGYALRPGQLVTLVNTEYGVSGVFRASEVSQGGIDDMTISVTLMQAFENLWDGNYKTITAASGNVPRRA